MLITKRKQYYYTQDDQRFITFGEAIGHAKRLAIAHYFLVLRHELHEQKGPLKADQKIRLRQVSDHIEEIFEERPALRNENGRPREQRPLAEAA